ncbi:MAG: ABC transporter permease subunit [Planctomycetes bacterium]|nr:ABC transporter permease subunit [Planctomycetota bacterium]
MSRLASLLVVLGVAGVAAFLVASALPLFASGEFFEILLGRWRPYASPGEFGIAPMIVGTILLAATATLLAAPAAIGLVAFAHGIAPRPLARLAMASVHFMTGIPTVLYGFVSVSLLVPFLRNAGAGGFSLLGAGLTLAALVLPTITLTLHSRIEATGLEVRLDCAALGMRPADTFLRVLLPRSGPGLLSATLLGFCRAAGDTVVALMVAGNAPQFPSSYLDSVRTLTAHIALVLSTDWSSPEFRSIAAAGLLLFVFNTALTAALRRLGPAEPPHVRELR